MNKIKYLITRLLYGSECCSPQHTPAVVFTDVQSVMLNSGCAICRGKVDRSDGAFITIQVINGEMYDNTLCSDCEKEQ